MNLPVCLEDLKTPLDGQPTLQAKIWSQVLQELTGNFEVLI